MATDDSALSRTSAPVIITIVAGFNTNITLISTGSVWRYRDTGEDLGDAWTPVGFNDANWSSGPAELGYGDSAEGRPEATMVSFGPNSAAKYITTYFRRRFVVEDVANFSTLNLRLLRDDGAVVHMNGVDVYRSNMPSGAVNYQTPASGGVGGVDETTYYSAALNAGYLVPGTNIVAVEIHQSSPGSSDISFDLELTGTISVVAPYIVVQPAAVSALAGQTAVFNVGVEGSQPMDFQWRFNGAVIPGAKTSTLTLSGVGLSAAGDYRVVVTNVAGFAISLGARLKVSNPDTDGDGLPDWWELANGTNPNANDAAEDLDHDGLSNQDEYIAGTLPNDGTSYLRIDRIVGGNEPMAVEFLAVSNRSYTVQFKDSLADLLWLKLADIPSRLTNRVERVVEPATGRSRRFYRLATPRAP